MKPSQKIALLSFIFFIIEGSYLLLYELDSPYTTLYAIIVILAFVISGELSIIAKRIERNREWINSAPELGEDLTLEEEPPTIESSGDKP